MNLITRKELYGEVDGELYRKVYWELYEEVYRKLYWGLYGEVYLELASQILTNFSHSKISRV
jgi:hypothetical protein